MREKCEEGRWENTTTTGEGRGFSENVAWDGRWAVVMGWMGKRRGTNWPKDEVRDGMGGAGTLETRKRCDAHTDAGTQACPAAGTAVTPEIQAGLCTASAVKIYSSPVLPKQVNFHVEHHCLSSTTVSQ
ncbi:hypothetical protein V498_05167 [Pseudogymnoascus sp. VKM F-4517 (FW-2822)]|nr:hypothetical protein V498_05167 [Pseudogymnoascus sp. VKM F-4517 (FW-2822)]